MKVTVDDIERMDACTLRAFVLELEALFAANRGRCGDSKQFVPMWARIVRRASALEKD